jgi:hypothetical protein
MKRLSLFAFLVAVLAISNGVALACPTAPSSLQGTYPNQWYDYTQAAACYTTSGNVGSGSDDCMSGTVWQFNSGTSTVTTSFTLTSSDPILDSTKWYITDTLKLTSPGGTSGDRIEVDMDVTHPNLSVSHYTLYFWSGASGNLACGSHSAYFTANTGDTITIIIAATNSGTATIRANVPTLLNRSF